jgi:hypothetical protein
MHRPSGCRRQPAARPDPQPAGTSPTADPIRALNRLLVALEGRRNFLGTDWGIARVSDASVAYSFRRGGSPAGHLLYLDIPWALGSIERISEMGDGTTELLVGFPARQVTYILEGLFGGRMRRLQHEHIATAPIRVPQRNARLAEEALERLIRDSGWRRPGSGAPADPEAGDRASAPPRTRPGEGFTPAAAPGSP